ncbi:MAG: hypothetical protein KDA24_01060 [Deltaproteobacteria bacterium]|nr:hypothetical protein [Deltaproteobacteria bacterium]
MTRIILALTLCCGLAACPSGEPDEPAEPTPAPVDFGTDVSGGLFGVGPEDPFPNAFLGAEDGRLDLDPAWFGGLPTEAIAWRQGFSRNQPIVATIEGLSGDGLPDGSDGDASDDAVFMVDLVTGDRVPVIAELDENVVPGRSPALLIQPVRPLTAPGRAAVVVTTDALPRPERFEALVAGTPPADYGGAALHYRALMEDLAGAGVSSDGVALAWDFPVDMGNAQLESGLAQRTLPTEWDFYDVRDLGESNALHNETWRYARAKLTVQDFLRDDMFLDVAPDGTISQTGTTDIDVFAIIPSSVADAPAGSVPVLLYGHGATAHPSYDLNTPNWRHPAVVAAERNGMIVLATTWRGLEFNDLDDLLTLDQNPERLIGVANRLVQAMVNTRVLVDVIEDGALFQDEVFQGAQGQALVDNSSLSYLGVSVGSVMGTALLAQEGVDVDAAVMTVGGGPLGFVIPRAAQVADLLEAFAEAIPEPTSRRRAFALFQLFTDAVDGINYPESIAGSRLYVENMGDDTVWNIATENLARAGGLTLLAPSHSAPWGIPVESGPLGPGDPILFQYDPQLGPSPTGNNPPDTTGAHGALQWSGLFDLVTAFLDPSGPGVASTPCGEDPCAADNDGAPPSIVEIIAVDSTTVTVELSWDWSTALTASMFSIAGLTVTDVVVAGPLATLTTSAQEANASYELVIAATAVDALGQEIPEEGRSGSFEGFFGLANLVINELTATVVGASASQECNRIELRAVEAGSLGGMEIRGRGTQFGGSYKFFTFPAVEVTVDDLIVLHLDGADCNEDGSGNESTSKDEYPASSYPQNHDGAWDFWTSASENVTAHDNAIWLKTELGGDLIDAVLIAGTSVCSGFVTANSTEARADWISDRGGWTTPAGATPSFYDEDFCLNAVRDASATGTTPSGTTLGRVDETDTNSRVDWTDANNSSWGALNPGQTALAN